MLLLLLLKYLTITQNKNWLNICTKIYHKLWVANRKYVKTLTIGPKQSRSYLSMWPLKKVSFGKQVKKVYKIREYPEKKMQL